MTAAYPSGTNTFVLSHDATKGMVVDFSRNPKDFAINSYLQIVPVDKVAGYYMKMTVEQAGRVQNTNLSDMEWADGNKAPEFHDGTEGFEFLAYATKRYALGFNLGDLSVDQASWDIVAQHGRITAQRAMTARTVLSVTALETSGNWDATHTSAVSSISGVTGKWDVSTTARTDIHRSLDYAADIILQDTLGAVDINDLILVISPACARAMAVTQEIVDHIKGSPDAKDQVRGEMGRNSMFGLPDKLYGYPVVVEKTVKTTNTKGATRAVSYAKGKTNPVMIARPGGLTGVANAPSFSTVTCFMKEEMTVETKREDDNRRTIGRIVENYAVVVTAPVSGFLFTSAVAT